MLSTFRPELLKIEFMGQKRHDRPLDEHIEMLDQRAQTAVDKLLEDPESRQLNQAWSVIRPDARSGEGARAYQQLGKKQFGQLVLEGIREHIRETAARNVPEISPQALPVLCEPPSASVVSALRGRKELSNALPAFLDNKVEEWWNRAEIAQTGHTRYQLLLALSQAVPETGLPGELQTVLQKRVKKHKEKLDGEKPLNGKNFQQQRPPELGPGNFEPGRELLLLRLILQKGRSAGPSSPSRP